MGPLTRLRYFIGDVLRHVAEFAEDQWFDRTRNVRTSGNVSLLHAGLTAAQFRDSEIYQPARPRHIRRALRDATLQNISEYSYVDLGSGKGRSLFVAAELPFRQVIGVERSQLLHDQANANIQGFRQRIGGCREVLSLEQDALDFVFPSGRIVLYMFNPFGRTTMQQALANLQASLKVEPRHVVVVLLWPRCEDLVATMPGAQLIKKTHEYQIFNLAQAE